VFEATHSERSTADAADIWALWADPKRWPDWNEQIERAEVEGALALGTEVRIKFRRGGTVRFEVTELEPERLFIDEARFPGARLGHEHRLDAGRNSVEISHRLYVTGPLAGLWSLFLGRKRLRESVTRFVERERELTEPKARASSKPKRGRRRR
jgi:uncharacterized protein YndB with AHSA1/START domain